MKSFKTTIPRIHFSSLEGERGSLLKPIPNAKLWKRGGDGGVLEAGLHEGLVKTNFKAGKEVVHLWPRLSAHLEALWSWELGSASYPGNLLASMLSTAERSDRAWRFHLTQTQFGMSILHDSLTSLIHCFFTPRIKEEICPQRVTVTLKREFHKAHVLPI